MNQESREGIAEFANYPADHGAGLLLNFATAPLTIKRFCRELPPGDQTDDLVL